MQNPIENKSIHSDAYWKEVDKLFALAEKKNLLEAINKSDTEKFYLFTRMLRITNTLKKARTSLKK